MSSKNNKIKINKTLRSRLTRMNKFGYEFVVPI